MLTRQKILMRLLELAGGSATRLQVTKWAFLLRQEFSGPETSTFYQFVPYHYGPFSFTLYHELDNMARDGLIQADDHKRVKLLDGAVPVLDPGAQRRIAECWKMYGALATSNLLDIVYANYPWFTSRSRLQPLQATSRKAESAIYTAGYGGISVDGFLNHLLEVGIRRVTDVRYNAYSRHYGYHGATLSRICGDLDLGYVHLPELGVPSSWRAGVVTQQAFEEIMKRYKEEVLQVQENLIRRLSVSFQTVPTVLVCQEACPEDCHRSLLADALSARAGLGITNLRPNGGQECTRQLAF